MKSDELRFLEEKVSELEGRQRNIEKDIKLLREIFVHVKERFDSIKKDG